jgi:hypothetical protein
MSPRDQLLIQSHFALVWWAETLGAKYFQSPQFKDLKFSDPFVQNRLADPGGAAASLIAPSLYVALVLPRETIFELYESEFSQLDALIGNAANVLENSYPYVPAIPFTRHLRNAIAHGRLAWNDSGIEFSDSNKQGHRLRVKIDLLTLGNLVHELQILLRKHVKSLQSAGA